MGFALWRHNGLLWAQGTHEYRPMGAAVIAASDLFRPRDFHPTRRLCVAGGEFLGFFASIGHLNAYLESRRRFQAKSSARQLPTASVLG